MSSNPEEPAGGEELQFEQADFGGEAASGEVACTACRQSIPDVYYEVNRHVTCGGCYARLRQEFFGGSRWRRAFGAFIYGVLAGLLGAGIYYGVAKATGYELGLIAIVVGFLVGGAVRKGSAGRGGWFYQLMAILLTYSSIAGSYLVFVVDELPAHARTQDQPTDETMPADQAATSDDAHSAATATQPSAPPTPMVQALSILVFVGLVGAFTLSLPVLMGISSPITFLIVGFALYEAWKINKRPALQVSGPYQVGDVRAGSGALPLSEPPAPDAPQ